MMCMCLSVVCKKCPTVFYRISFWGFVYIPVSVLCNYCCWNIFIGIEPMAAFNFRLHKVWLIIEGGYY